MTIEAIKAECAREGIGQGFWNLLVAVCGRVARKYHPLDVYNYGQQWGQESYEALAQEVVLDRLLPKDQEQLKYVLAQAQSEDELARLLSFQIRRVLSRRRGIQVTDRLLTRVRAMGTTEPLALWSSAGNDWIAAHRVAEPRPLSPAEVREAITIVADVPRLPPPASGSRESMIYTPDSMRTLVGRLTTRFESIDFEALREIFESLLTPWLPTILRESEDTHDSAGSIESTEFVAQRNAMEAQVVAAANEFNPVWRRIVVAKFGVGRDEEKVSDAKLAEELRVSRPTVAKYGQQALEEIRSLADQVPDELREDAVRSFLNALIVLEVDQ